MESRDELEEKGVAHMKRLTSIYLTVRKSGSSSYVISLNRLVVQLGYESYDIFFKLNDFFKDKGRILSIKIVYFTCD